MPGEERNKTNMQVVSLTEGVQKLSIGVEVWRVVGMVAAVAVQAKPSRAMRAERRMTLNCIFASACRLVSGSRRGSRSGPGMLAMMTCSKPEDDSTTEIVIEFEVYRRNNKADEGF